jgi:uncharacterized protein
MEESGIDCSVLVSFPWRSPDLCRENNNYLLDQCAKYDESFMAICSVQPARSGCLEEAARCLDRGAIGIKINPEWQGGCLDDPAIGRLARYVSERGRFILTHIAQPFRKSPASAAHLFSLLKRNPSVRIVAAHMGGLLGLYATFPPTSGVVKSLWFDTAVSETLEIVHYYVQAGVSDRVLFATDYPFNLCHSQKIVKDRIMALRITRTIKNKILGENFRCLLQAH